MKRWEKHFGKLFELEEDDLPNPADVTGNSVDLDRLQGRPRRPVEKIVDVLSKTEILDAISKVKREKSLGLDNIFLEVIRADENVSAQLLIPLFKEIRVKEGVPEDCKKGLIVKVPKK